MRKAATPWIAIVALGFALGACEPQAADEGATTEDTAADPAAEIESLRVDYEEAYNRGDLDALVMMYTPDAMAVSTTGVQRGREAIRADLEATGVGVDTTGARAAGAPTLSIETEDLTVAESGDVAYGAGTTTVTFTGPEGQETARQRWMVGFVKQDGEWKVDQLVLSEPMPEGAMDEAAPGEGATDEGAAAEGETSM